MVLWSGNMYSHEIENYLKVRNYLLKTPAEILEVTDHKKSPQINWVKFHNGPNNYEMTTTDNYYFKFHVLTIEEYAKECEEAKKLIK
jgi:hypothetical protein